MKHQGCILQFTEQRNKELMRAYRRVIESSSFIDLSEISVKVVNSPCSRFWVSEERSMAVISAILKGKPILDSMRPMKREMYQDMLEIVLRLRNERPNDPLSDIVSDAVHSPAKKFYMMPRCSIEIIYKIKNGFYDKKK